MKMKILMMAWRDMKHPSMGGAEIVTDIYLSALSKKGHQLTLFSSRFEGSKEEETYNGYKIIRQGKGLSTHWKGMMFAKHNQEKYDVIIDQINTIPFFTPLVVKREKRVAFFHQLCKNIWFYEASFPVSLVGYILESIYLKFYKNTRCITVSNSTKEDLVKYAWVKPKNVLVLENNINFKPLNKPNTKENQFVVCGRITNSKRIHDCIKALALVNNKETKLVIIGRGNEDYKQKLVKLINKLGLQKRVIFTGSIPSKERNTIMSHSQAILVTSVREGWGLIVTEANANGTVAITYDVPGLRDANDSGFITKDDNTPEALANYMDIIIENKQLMLNKSKEALKSSHKRLNWNKNVQEMERWLKQ